MLNFFKGLFILREVEQKWIKASSSIFRSSIEASVEMSNIIKSLVHCVSCPVLIKSIHKIWLKSSYWIFISVLSSEWVETCKLNPSCTKLLSLLGSFTTDVSAGVWTCQWDTKHIEVHDTSNCVCHVFPISMSFSKLMMSVSS